MKLGCSEQHLFYQSLALGEKTSMGGKTGQASGRGEGSFFFFFAGEVSRFSL